MVAMDFGHNHVAVAVADAEGTVLAERWTTIDVDGQAQASLDLAARIVIELLEEAGVPRTDVRCAAAGIPAPVDSRSHEIRSMSIMSDWVGINPQKELSGLLGWRVIVANDANAAVLAEHSFGSGDSDLMLITVGHGVGAGTLLGGTPIFGGHSAAGEIGHVVVGDDEGLACACGKSGCLETWLAAPRLEAALAAADGTRRDTILREAGRRLGVAVAPVVGALDLSEIVLSGPIHLLDGPLAQAADETIRARTMADFHGDLRVRMTALGDDIVMRGAAAMVLARELGVS